MKTSPTQTHTAAHTDLLSRIGWTLTDTLNLPARDGQWTSPTSLGLTEPALRTATLDARGIYLHQEAAIREIIAGRDTAVTTGTNSGKSLIFQTAGIDLLARDPQARILVFYPLRALAEEQFERWNAALAKSGLDATAALILGSNTDKAQRLKAITRARVVIATPDVIHAWMMLYRWQEPALRNFLRRLRMLVIDEAHAYTAVFGSQSAFLIRRLDHAVRLLGGMFQVVAASATMADPGAHLRALTGRNFTLIGSDLDSSPLHARSIYFVTPRGGTELISGLGAWFRTCADAKAGRFLAFVESRVQAEHFARVAGRRINDSDGEFADTATDAEFEKNLEGAAGGAVRAYRSGYDATYRRELVEQLRSGDIAGLVSTSALELGMDLPDLSTGFIIGAPRSATSLFQRLGRFGRHGPASIYMVDDGSPSSAALFSDPAGLLKLPLQSSTLYLDNPRVQYIHVLCQAREEGWADIDNPPSEFRSEVEFPAGFTELCRKELLGESVGDLRSLRPVGDEPPHLAFPLRDCDLQFTVKSVDGRFSMPLGTLTFAQVLREAYPGAAYWHAGCVYRVRSVQVTRRTVIVERCRAAFTKPRSLPPVLTPDLTVDGVLSWVTHGSLSVIETHLQARECVNGFHERRGSATRDALYPLPSSDPSGAVYSYPRFCRHIDSTGVMLTHRVFSDESVRISEIAEVVEEAFLQIVPIERQDIAAGTGRIRADRCGLQRGDRFVAIYDRTYGSLRLSSRLATAATLREILARAVALAESGIISDLATLAALRIATSDAAEHPAKAVSLVETPDAPEAASGLVRVIRPGSCGSHRGNGATFIVAAVFYAPDGVRYRGRFDHQPASDNTGSLPASVLTELPGETEWTSFDPETGETIA